MPNIPYNILFALTLAALISYLVNYFIVRRADILRLIDEPNHRSSHSIPTPRGGGLGILFGFTIGVIIAWSLSTNALLIDFVLLIGWILAAIGLYDDLVSCSAIVRLLFQMLAIVLLFTILHYFSPGYTLTKSTLLSLSILIIAFLSGVWLINLYNFMDGINGFASSETIFVLLAASITLYCMGISSLVIPYMLILASACFGFLLWNFPRAKIFMGDTGSLFLGFIIAFFVFYTTLHHQLSIITWLIWLSVFWVDATYTLLVRLFSGQRFHTAHRSHHYQIIARRWHSHVKVVFAVVMYNIIWLLPLSYLSIRLSHLGVIWLAMAILPILLSCIAFGSGKNNQ
ncbi:MAG: MraY family glycosyltransferase [Gammaproteobacteria bacterium]